MFPTRVCADGCCLARLSRVGRGRPSSTREGNTRSVGSQALPLKGSGTSLVSQDSPRKRLQRYVSFLAVPASTSRQGNTAAAYAPTCSCGRAFIAVFMTGLQDQLVSKVKSSSDHLHPWAASAHGKLQDCRG